MKSFILYLYLISFIFVAYVKASGDCAYLVNFLKSSGINWDVNCCTAHTIKSDSSHFVNCDQQNNINTFAFYGNKGASKLSGRLQDLIDNLPYLEWLGVPYNNLEGNGVTIPSNSKINNLIISYNYLSGKVEINNNNEYNFLILSNNQFEGELVLPNQVPKNKIEIVKNNFKCYRSSINHNFDTNLQKCTDNVQQNKVNDNKNTSSTKSGDSKSTPSTNSNDNKSIPAKNTNDTISIPVSTLIAIGISVILLIIIGVLAFLLIIKNKKNQEDTDLIYKTGENDDIVIYTKQNSTS